MKSILKALTLCAIIGSASTATADTTVYVDAGKTWNGYMNVFDLPDDGQAYKFGSGWGIADLRASFSGSELTLSPNTIGDPNEFWYQNTSGTATPPNVGGPGQAGNKFMEANLYVEVNDGSLSDQLVTFTGTVNSYSLTEAHDSVAFIKDFAPDYSSFKIQTVGLEQGTFTVSLQTEAGAGRHVQYGFQTTGENVWITDVAPFGSVKIAAIPAVAGNPNVTVDPAAEWKGYRNVSDLPANGGGFLYGEPVPVTSELRAGFSGSVLTLSPFTINPQPDGLNDTTWYQPDGSGNRSVEANFYVEPPAGSLSGETVNFTGTVLAGNLAPGHTSIAFIKEYTADYSSFTISSTPLVPGPFSISLAISNDPTKHVQYGFQTVGPNVWPAYAGNFGSVRVTNTSPSAYTTWIGGFDFSALPSADLTATGDPEGDGRRNFEEFALNDDPSSGAASGKVRARVEEVAGEQALVYTLPVRGTPTFTGSPSKTAAVDQIEYSIEGTNGLATFDQAVSEVTPASSAGMPPVSSGWSYRSFRLDGAVGGNTPRGPAGFLRARISEAP
jgi:hypothetical protein